MAKPASARHHSVTHCGHYTSRWFGESPARATGGLDDRRRAESTRSGTRPSFGYLMQHGLAIDDWLSWTSPCTSARSVSDAPAGPLRSTNRLVTQLTAQLLHVATVQYSARNCRSALSTAQSRPRVLLS